MKKTCLLLIILAGTLFQSCKKEDDTPTADSKYQEEGYVMATATQSSAGYSYYAGYYPTLPTGNVDLTAKSSYAVFLPRATWKNYMYGNPLVSDQKLSKMAVVKATGAVEEVASIPLLDYLQHVIIINDNLGVYSAGGNRALFMFNPTTMESLGQIDMSKATTFAANEENSYAQLIYRASDNRLFACLYTNSTKTGQFYDAVNVYVEVVNMATKQWEKTTMFEQATYPFSRGSNNSLVDENGNIFIICQGQTGLDGQLGPNAAKRSRPQILKIPAGTTEFDKTYSFNPVNAAGFPNLMFQLLVGGIYDSNGIAYACISGQADSPRLLELIGKLATNTITATEYGELQNLAFFGAFQRWAKLDLNAKTATFIQDLPLTAGYGYPVSYKYDGKFYFPIYNATQNQNGFYSYDPSANKSTQLNSVTSGGILTHLLKLTK